MPKHKLIRAICPALLAISSMGVTTAYAQQPASTLVNPMAQSMDHTPDENGMTPENAWLESLIADGTLRRMSKEGITAIAQSGARIQPAIGNFVVTGDDPMKYVGESKSAYLALKPFDTIHPGLAGADSVIFMAPTGIRLPPLQHFGHNDLYVIIGYTGPSLAGPSAPLDERALMIQKSNLAKMAAEKAARGTTIPSPTEMVSSASPLKIVGGVVGGLVVMLLIGFGLIRIFRR